MWPAKSMSATASIPPGRRASRIFANALPGSSRCDNKNRACARSKPASRSDSFTLMTRNSMLVSPRARASRSAAAILIWSISTAVTLPAGPTMRASSNATSPPPHPRSRHLIPGAMPTDCNRLSVDGHITRDSKRRRSLPSIPPRMLYRVIAESGLVTYVGYLFHRHWDILGAELLQLLHRNRGAFSARPRNGAVPDVAARLGAGRIVEERGSAARGRAARHRRRIRKMARPQAQNPNDQLARLLRAGGAH